MMRFILLAVLMIAFIPQAEAQGKLKRKYYGTYNGNINAYKLETGGDILNIAAVPIQVDLFAGTLNIHIGKITTKGTYTVLFEAEEYSVLDCVMENNSIGERIIVYKKGKKISRDGLYPQPSAMLYKTD